MFENLDRLLATPIGTTRRFWRTHAVTVLALVWICLGFYEYALVVKGQLNVGMSDGNGRPLGECFINFWSGAKLAALGHISDLYDWERFHQFEQETVSAKIDYYHYSYPPVMPLLTWPLALMPYAGGLFLWLTTTWGLFYAALRAAKPSRSALLLALALPAVIFNLTSGQNGALTAALLGGGLVLLPKRPLVAGILLGMLCFKPQLVFLVPLALVSGKYWRTLIVAAITSVTLVALSILIYGPEIWVDYLHSTTVLRHYVLEDNIPHSWQQFVSVFVTVRQMGGSIVVSYAVQGLFTLLASAAIIRLWVKPSPHSQRCATLLIGTFLATPYVMDYDLVVTAFAIVWLAQSYTKTWLAIALIVLMPIVSTVCGTYYGINAGPFMLMPAFALVLSTSVRPRLSPDDPSFA